MILISSYIRKVLNAESDIKIESIPFELKLIHFPVEYKPGPFPSIAAEMSVEYRIRALTRHIISMNKTHKSCTRRPNITKSKYFLKE